MVVEIIHRHVVEPRDGFAMRPGYRNFQRVEEGEVLAHDATGGIAARMSGILVMPLYQDQGEDGFFIARSIRRSWLGVSTMLRTLRVDRLLPFLPGVRRDKLRPARLLVDPHIARWFSVQLFHLCGFRRLADRGDTLVFTRRVE
jgi:succinylglutamate desuccinylase